MSSRPTFLVIDALCMGLALALGAGTYLLGIEPAMRYRAQHDQLRAEIADLTAEAESGEGSSRLREDARKKLLTELEATRVTLRPASQLNLRVQNVTELAGKHQFNVEQVSPGKPENGLTAVTIPIRLTGSSSYPSAKAFLADLRRQFPDMSVSALRMVRTPGPLDTPTPRATVEFSLAWHAMPADRAGEDRTTSAEKP